MSRQETKALYYHGLKPITQNDVESALREVGLREGDVVMVHSDVGSFGKLGDIKNKNEFLKSILDAFLSVIGSKGTLIVPTYTYSFCKNQIFDIKNSKSTVGIFTEFVRTHEDAIRSEDPIFSHSGIGKNAKKLLKNVSNVCFGKDSFFDRLYKFNGKMVNFGKFFDITFLHYIENAFGVGHRFNKKFSGTIVREDGSRCNKEVVYYVRHLPKDGKDVEYDMTLLGDELERRGLLRRVSLGNSYILSSKARDCCELGLSMLKKDEHAFLTKDPNVLEFKKLPFFIGVLDSPENKGFPLSLSFVLEFDRNSGLIVQRYSKEREALLMDVYKKGSLISTNLGQGSFGVARAEDALKHLLKNCRLPINESCFLELGCGDGYLLHRLKLLGAKKVLGCEPGPAGREGEKKYGIEILNSFYKPELFNEKFDLIFSYGLLEHIHNPLEIIISFSSCLKENGKIFVAVPNCENKLRLGDVSILSHEHWNYFTRQSLRNLLIRSNLSDVETTIGINEAMIYGRGTKASRKQEITDLTGLDKELFYTFCAKIKRILPIFQKRIDTLNRKGKTLGLYGGGLKVVGLLKHKLEPRFFDGDIAKHGKFFPGYKNPIEKPQNLITAKVDELWIMATDYDKEIIDYLTNELTVSSDINIISFKRFLEDFKIEWKIR